jgi:TRAP-type C4-dicarboxylate transport system substrate-binding protein
MAVGVVSFPPLNKNYNVTSLPGVFSSYDQIRGFFSDTETGRAIMEDIKSSAGIDIIGYDPVGPSAVFTTREDIASIGDYEGVSARVLTDADRPRWEALGAGRMVSLPTGEVYTALQSGMVDTVATVPGAIKGYSWWDFLKTAQLPYFQFNDAYFIVNKAWLDGLSPELRKTVMEVGSEISAESTDAIMEASNKTLEEFKEHGGKVVVFEGEALEGLSKLEVEQVLPKMQDAVDQDAIDAALDYTGQK